MMSKYPPTDRVGSLILSEERERVIQQLKKSIVGILQRT
jgi:hypothetical protein